MNGSQQDLKQCLPDSREAFGREPCRTGGKGLGGVEVSRVGVYRGVSLVDSGMASHVAGQQVAGRGQLTARQFWRAGPDVSLTGSLLAQQPRVVLRVQAAAATVVVGWW